MVIQPSRFDRYQRPKVSSGYTWNEKIVSALVYIPVALVGFLIGIVYILAKQPGCDAPFFRFHFYQSIFLSVLVFVISGLFGAMSGLISGILQLAAPVLGAETASFLNANQNFVTMAFQLPLLLLCPYAAIMALLGKTTNIPWVSNLINRNMSGR